MKLPKKIKVLTEVYEIKFAKGLIETENAEGMTYPDMYLILIDENLKDNKKAFKRALWHELVHAYMFESGVHEFTSRDANEMIAQTLSAFILQIGDQKLL
jgi:hypothetical protein